MLPVSVNIWIPNNFRLMFELVEVGLPFSISSHSVWQLRLIYSDASYTKIVLNPNLKRNWWHSLSDKWDGVKTELSRRTRLRSKAYVTHVHASGRRPCCDQHSALAAVLQIVEGIQPGHGSSSVLIHILF